MKTQRATSALSKLPWTGLAAVCLCSTTTPLVASAQHPTRTSRPVSAEVVKSFATPQQAVDALMAAAGKFDVGALEELFGPKFREVVLTGEYGRIVSGPPISSRRQKRRRVFH